MYGSWKHSRMAALVLILGMGVGDAMPAVEAQTAEPPAADASMEAAPETRLKLWYPLGLGFRNGSAMASMELLGARWNGRSPAWGLGVRSSIDQVGPRVGPKVFARLPLGGKHGAYAQLGGSYYLLSIQYTAHNQGDRALWGIEAELAPVSWAALAFGVERLRLRSGQPDGSSWVRNESEAYLGVKSSHWRTLVIAAVVVGLAGLVAATGPSMAGW